MSGFYSGEILYIFVLEHLKEYRQMFDMVLEGEKHVTQAKNNLVILNVK